MAGIQMDQRVIQAFGCHAGTVISANTAQHGRAVLSINPVAGQGFAEQLQACTSLAPAAVKIGLLVTVEQVRLCADFLRRIQVPAVLDPVLASSSGSALVSAEVRASLCRELLPLCTVVTPNRPEAELLGGQAIHCSADVAPAAAGLRASGVAAVVLKGGHGPAPDCRDYCLLPGQAFWLASERQAAANQRGTGCAFASAAASALALGYGLADALVIAKMALNQGLRQGYAVHDQPGPVHVHCFPDDGRDLPTLLPEHAAEVASPPFPPCGPGPLGLYPVVDSSAWLATLLPLGINTIQLRLKDKPAAVLDEEIQRAVALARRWGARLFINDHWPLALQHGAYGVHLGQQDLGSADLDAIRRGGLRLGISTHCHYEVARAHYYRPSYMACGPVYPTDSKSMPWQPHGLAGLAYWRRTLAAYPLVAIGGIDRDRLPGVAATGVDGIAMISAITKADRPTAAATALAELCEVHRP
ncbi:thiamine phosphate synthase [Kineobactrum salinum]|uniref:Thiamine-phosphate synthase n=2 Tax=Kineobactrum salinum TaxID=2708301 RepID=A0A6C0U5X1_9GAMM|nr:thiamine phosphate synthase [Kineobactrum salinum]